MLHCSKKLHRKYSLWCGGRAALDVHIPPAARNKISTWVPSQGNFLEEMLSREVWDMVPFNSRARSEEYSLNQQDSPTPGLCVHARL